MDAPYPPRSENAAEFAWRHDDVFGRIASRYDLLCDVFSVGIHRLWKRRAARRIAREPGSVLLDGATGTGDIILRVLAHQATEGRAIVAAVSRPAEASPAAAWQQAPFRLPPASSMPEPAVPWTRREAPG